MVCAVRRLKERLKALLWDVVRVVTRLVALSEEVVPGGIDLVLSDVVMPHMDGRVSRHLE
jgi:CheY-like chemotaxis protein